MRFWRKTHDPLFAFFAAAFLLLGIERIGILVFAGGTEGSVYLIRLVAFVLILAGIIGKIAAVTSSEARTPLAISHRTNEGLPCNAFRMLPEWCLSC